MLDMSYEEKSCWVSTLSVTAVAAWYVTTFWPLVAGAEPLPAVALIGPTVGATAVLVVLQVGGHVVAALLGRPRDADERDRAIALRATRLADLAMGVCVFTVIAHLLTAELGLLDLPDTPAFTAFLLMLALVVSTLVEGLTRIVCYRAAA